MQNFLSAAAKLKMYKASRIVVIVNHRDHESHELRS